LFSKKIKKYFGKTDLYLTGGEPFVREDIVEVLNLLPKYFKKITVNSNFGLVSENKLRSINLKAVDFIVSLDGPEKIHDKIRRNKGLYKKAIKNIKVLNKLGKKVVVNCVVSKYNVGDLKDWFKQLSSLNISFSLQHVMWINKENILKQRQLNKNIFGINETPCFPLKEDVVIPKSKINILKQEIKSIRKTALNRDVEFKEIGMTGIGLYDYYHNFNCNMVNKRCTDFSLRILANGDVKMCMGPVIGNVLKNSIPKILDSKKRKEILKSINQKFKTGKLFPACVKCCKLA
jgi:sulfatase maturation enzyme AslB (radical SAM superfamily)